MVSSCLLWGRRPGTQVAMPETLRLAFPKGRKRRLTGWTMATEVLTLPTKNDSGGGRCRARVFAVLLANLNNLALLAISEDPCLREHKQAAVGDLLLLRSSNGGMT